VTPADFHTSIRDNEDKITVWGVYPGVTDMFVAVDSSDYEHRIRKASTREYYDLCGYNIATETRRTWKQEETTES
jgi:hypothetical protein